MVQRWLVDGDSDRISRHFLKVLNHLDKKWYGQVNATSKYELSRIVQDLLYVLAQPEFTIAEQDAAEWIQQNTVIANLVAMTPFETTDRCLDMICDAQQSAGNTFKVCALYSCRNRKKIDRRAIVDASPAHASLWYSNYMGAYPTALADPECHERLREHILFFDERLDLTRGHPCELYYAATYIDHQQDRILKRRVNEAFQQKDRSVAIRNRRRTTTRPKAAIISDLWIKVHSAYRIQYHLVASLKDHFHLTLVHAAFRDTKRFDTTLFDETIWIGGGSNGVDLSPILDNDFELAYFPDVGMTDQSIRLANLRIAPIQMCGLGHSVSTYGSQIDYFVTGDEVELAVGAEDNYSEKLIRLPGFGAIHNAIRYERKHRPVRHDRLIVNCSWTPQKANARMLGLLRRVKDRVSRPVLFRFFPMNYSLRWCGHESFVKAVQKILGKDSIEIVPGLVYERYMEAMEEGTVCADAFPFGGCNTVADALYLRKPVVCLEGDHWYNRIGPAMLRRVGLNALIADSPDAYVKILAEMIESQSKQEEVEAILNACDLERSLFAVEGQAEFRDACLHLVNALHRGEDARRDVDHHRERDESARDAIWQAETGGRSRGSRCRIGTSGEN